MKCPRCDITLTKLEADLAGVCGPCYYEGHTGNARLATDLAAAIARAQAAERERDKLRRLLSDWYAEECREDSDNLQNAPGHCHKIRGIWDSDNGAKAGEPCARCAMWFAIAAQQAEGE